ncbi:hypothetical protein ASD75_07180 [Acidovorax sp. Root568]|nr:hypothetical protein ASD75_07180 [Acidovorax sp. Root568]
MQPLTVADVCGKTSTVVKPDHSQLATEAREVLTQFTMRNMAGFGMSTMRPKCTCHSRLGITPLYHVV